VVIITHKKIEISVEEQFRRDIIERIICNNLESISNFLSSSDKSKELSFQFNPIIIENFLTFLLYFIQQQQQSEESTQVKKK
jgi:hypothetical protein